MTAPTQALIPASNVWHAKPDQGGHAPSRAGLQLTALLVSNLADKADTPPANSGLEGLSTVWQTSSARDGLHLFLEHRPHLLLVDTQLSTAEVHWLVRQVRQRDPDHGSYIVLLSRQAHDKDLNLVMETEADDYLHLPISAQALQIKFRTLQTQIQVRQRLKTQMVELLNANEQLRGLVERDSLTGLINRRGLDRLLAVQLRQALRDRQPLTMVLVDVDHFKRYNDALGHVQGDTCLQHVARLLQDLCKRPSDVATRYGGEEFALILPNTPAAGAIAFAQTCLQMLRSLNLYHPDSPVAPFVTLSAGMTSSIPDKYLTPAMLIQRADEALYTAKARGRDRFFCFDTEKEITAHPMSKPDFD